MKWAKENPERYRQLSNESRARVLDDPVRLQKRRDSIRRYYAENAATVIESHRKWRAKNLWAKTADRCRSAIRNVIYGVSCRGPKAEALLGCTVFEFRAIIEKQFEPGMTWKNFGRGGWTLSHRRAVREFKDVMHTEAGRNECFHHSNLKPEWEWSNRAKHTRPELTTAQTTLGTPTPPLRLGWRLW